MTPFSCAHTERVSRGHGHVRYHSAGMRNVTWVTLAASFAAAEAQEKRPRARLSSGYPVILLCGQRHTREAALPHQRRFSEEFAALDVGQSPWLGNGLAGFDLDPRVLGIRRVHRFDCGRADGALL